MGMALAVPLVDRGKKIRHNLIEVTWRNDVSYWLFQPEVWLIFGLVLIGADILFGFAMFVLPVGLAAAIVSGLVYMESNFWFSDQILIEGWREVLLIFAALSLILVFVVRRVFQPTTDKSSDINDY